MADYAGLTLDSKKISDAILSFPGNTNVAPAVDGVGFKTYLIDNRRLGTFTSRPATLHCLAHLASATSSLTT